MEIIKRSDLPQGGFAGLTEHRLLKDARLFGRSNDGTWPRGIGNFVYLADARFQPLGDTRMHPHRDVDILSFMVEGRLRHEGSLGEGNVLIDNDVQVQRAGGKGLIHNEVNPDESWNRMLQLWILPENQGEEPGYQIIRPQRGALTRIYGGTVNQGVYASRTLIDAALFNDQMVIERAGDFVAYLIEGEGQLNGQDVIEGDFIKGRDFNFIAKGNGYLLLAQQSD